MMEHPDPRLLLIEAPMSRYQWGAVIVLGLLFMLDGFDVMTIAFAAPALLAEWGISKAQLGGVLSAGLFGMAIGAVALSPFADALGRRRVLALALLLTISGTLWSAFCHDIVMLGLSRLLTGLGIGAMLGIVSSLAAEYANGRRRDFVVSLTMLGYALGAILGGMLSAWLLVSSGWRSIFLFAAGAGVAMLIASWRFLPEPPALVIARPGRDGLARVNAYLQRCGHAPVAALPAPLARDRIPIAMLFGRDMAKDTLLLTAIYFCYMIPNFYMQTWLPTLVAEAGLSASQSAMVAACMSVGGVGGTLFVAGTSLRFGIKRLQVGLSIAAAATVFLFALVPADFALLAVAAVVTGFFLAGGMVGYYAVIARTFPAHMRASGTGFVIGIGRLGSTVPPLLAGLLFTIGMSRPAVSLLMALPALLSMLFLLAMRVKEPTSA
jgi:benzoate transport